MFIGIDNRPRDLFYFLPEIQENALPTAPESLWELPVTAQQRYDESKRVPIGRQPLSRRSFPGGAIYPTDKPSSKRKPAKETLGNDFTNYKV
ncbi:hypothetical protein VSU19_18965 [Verrucomicrobiales bacterium BCK34]|nr:hypothetical protein [Verrucomicrobiales bacterium BCK34]